jgi:hypothetical protein
MPKSANQKGSSIGLIDAKGAVDRATAQTYTDNVFLFVPNLIGTILFRRPQRLSDTFQIGYTRIILAGLSLHFMSYHPKYCTLLYCLSCLLDAVDGQAARLLGQTSKFGAVLDMVTDRCAFSLTSVYCHHLTSGEMHDFVFVVLPIIGLSHICSLLPVSDRSRLQQPLYAYVQVCARCTLARCVAQGDRMLLWTVLW